MCAKSLDSSLFPNKTVILLIKKLYPTRCAKTSDSYSFNQKLYPTRCFGRCEKFSHSALNGSFHKTLIVYISSHAQNIWTYFHVRLHVFYPFFPHSSCVHFIVHVSRRTFLKFCVYTRCFWKMCAPRHLKSRLVSFSTRLPLFLCILK